MAIKSIVPPAAPVAPVAPPVAAAPAAPAVKKEKKPIDPNAPVLLTKGAFKKSAFLVSRSTVKQDKLNLKPTLFKRKLLFITAAVLRLMGVVNLMRADLTKMLAGEMITLETRKNAGEMLGFVFQHLFVAARNLKAKIPAIGRGKQDGSTFDLFMAFDKAASELFGMVSGAIEGIDLQTEENQLKMQGLVETCLACAIALSKALVQKTAQEIVTEHEKFLRVNSPAAFLPPPPPAPMTPEEAAKKAANAEKMKAAKASKAAAAKAAAPAPEAPAATA